MQHLISAVFQRHRDRTILGVLVAASLALLFLPSSTKLDASRSILGTLFVPVERWMDFVEDYFGLRAENERLERLVASLTLERARLLQFREERERLRRLAAFKEDHFYRLVPAEVIGANLDRHQSVLVIDKGSADSLEVRMPVFSYQGLAGRLSNVFEHSSWVQLITSKNHPVSCIDKRSRVVGVLEWRHRDIFELTNVSVVEDIVVGDTLVTSGYGGVVPKGFAVAVVTRAVPASDGLSLHVEAQGVVHFRSLEEVFVMTEAVPWDRAVFYEAADTVMMRDILLEPGGPR
jgi:rod shape-determining protein MreC